MKVLKNIKYSFLLGIGVGLYPILLFFTNNYTLVNTFWHLLFFVSTFILIPSFIFYILNRVLGVATKKKHINVIATFITIFGFLFFLIISIHAYIPKKITLGALIISLVLSYLLYKYHIKIVVLQYLIAIVGLISFIPVQIKQLSFSNDWIKIEDSILDAKFVYKPNIYLIQPDGYVNFSELYTGHYSFKNKEFENFLSSENFKLYPNFRSNYASTLSTNVSIFTMKHHYYNGGSTLSEALNARDLIMGDNSVLKILKKNGYKTHYVAEKPYLLLNRPSLAYDYCNFDYSEIPYIATGLKITKNITSEFENAFYSSTTQPNFFFIEFLSPGHIQNKKRNSKGVVEERKQWLNNLEKANSTLTNLVTLIKENDPNGLIIIMADHGGYVGLEFAEQSKIKTTDERTVYSMFSSILAIHWTNQNIPTFDYELKTSVNVFRILFSHLSKNESFLKNLEENKSFMLLDDKDYRGVYSLLNEKGKVKIEKNK